MQADPFGGVPRVTEREKADADQASARRLDVQVPMAVAAGSGLGVHGTPPWSEIPAGV
jgi:hypothetical protein